MQFVVSVPIICLGAQVTLKKFVGLLTDPCDADEDWPKWSKSSVLAKYEKVEYCGGDAGQAKQIFQKGNKLLARLQDKKLLKPHRHHQHLKSGAVWHAEIWGEVCLTLPA